MNVNELVRAGLFFGLLIALTPLLGGYMTRVFQGQRTWLAPVPATLEKSDYRLGGTAPDEDMSRRHHFWAGQVFNMLRLPLPHAAANDQAHLPLIPQHFPTPPWALAVDSFLKFPRPDAGCGKH